MNKFCVCVYALPFCIYTHTRVAFTRVFVALHTRTHVSLVCVALHVLLRLPPLLLPLSFTRCCVTRFVVAHTLYTAFTHVTRGHARYVEFVCCVRALRAHVPRLHCVCVTRLIYVAVTVYVAVTLRCTLRCGRSCLHCVPLPVAQLYIAIFPTQLRTFMPYCTDFCCCCWMRLDLRLSLVTARLRSRATHFAVLWTHTVPLIAGYTHCIRVATRSLPRSHVTSRYRLRLRLHFCRIYTRVCTRCTLRFTLCVYALRLRLFAALPLYLRLRLRCRLRSSLWSPSLVVPRVAHVLSFHVRSSPLSFAVYVALHVRCVHFTRALRFSRLFSRLGAPHTFLVCVTLRTTFALLHARVVASSLVYVCTFTHALRFAFAVLSLYGYTRTTFTHILVAVVTFAYSGYAHAFRSFATLRLRCIFTHTVFMHAVTRTHTYAYHHPHPTYTGYALPLAFCYAFTLRALHFTLRTWFGSRFTDYIRLCRLRACRYACTVAHTPHTTHGCAVTAPRISGCAVTYALCLPTRLPCSWLPLVHRAVLDLRATRFPHRTALRITHLDYAHRACYGLRYYRLRIAVTARCCYTHRALCTAHYLYLTPHTAGLPHSWLRFVPFGYLPVARAARVLTVLAPTGLLWLDLHHTLHTTLYTLRAFCTDHLSLRYAHSHSPLSGFSSFLTSTSLVFTRLRFLVARCTFGFCTLRLRLPFAHARSSLGLRCALHVCAHHTPAFSLQILRFTFYALSFHAHSCARTRVTRTFADLVCRLHTLRTVARLHALTHTFHARMRTLHTFAVADFTRVTRVCVIPVVTTRITHRTTHVAARYPRTALFTLHAALYYGAVLHGLSLRTRISVARYVAVRFPLRAFADPRCLWIYAFCTFAALPLRITARTVRTVAVPAVLPARVWVPFYARWNVWILDLSFGALPFSRLRCGSFAGFVVYVDLGAALRFDFAAFYVADLFRCLFDCCSARLGSARVPRCPRLRARTRTLLGYWISLPFYVAVCGCTRVCAYAPAIRWISPGLRLDCAVTAALPHAHLPGLLRGLVAHVAFAFSGSLSPLSSLVAIRTHTHTRLVYRALLRLLRLPLPLHAHALPLRGYHRLLRARVLLLLILSFCAYICCRCVVSRSPRFFHPAHVAHCLPLPHFAFPHTLRILPFSRSRLRLSLRLRLRLPFTLRTRLHAFAFTRLVRARFTRFARISFLHIVCSGLRFGSLLRSLSFARVSLLGFGSGSGCPRVPRADRFCHTTRGYAHYAPVTRLFTRRTLRSPVGLLPLGCTLPPRPDSPRFTTLVATTAVACALTLHARFPRISLPHVTFGFAPAVYHLHATHTRTVTHLHCHALPLHLVTFSHPLLGFSSRCVHIVAVVRFTRTRMPDLVLPLPVRIALCHFTAHATPHAPAAHIHTWLRSYTFAPAHTAAAYTLLPLDLWLPTLVATFVCLPHNTADQLVYRTVLRFLVGSGSRWCGSACTPTRLRGCACPDCGLHVYRTARRSYRLCWILVGFLLPRLRVPHLPTRLRILNLGCGCLCSTCVLRLPRLRFVCVCVGFYADLPRCCCRIAAARALPCRTPPHTLPRFLFSGWFLLWFTVATAFCGSLVSFNAPLPHAPAVTRAWITRSPPGCILLIGSAAVTAAVTVTRCPLRTDSAFVYVYRYRVWSGYGYARLVARCRTFARLPRHTYTVLVAYTPRTACGSYGFAGCRSSGFHAYLHAVICTHLPRILDFAPHVPLLDAFVAAHHAAVGFTFTTVGILRYTPHHGCACRCYRLVVRFFLSLLVVAPLRCHAHGCTRSLIWFVAAFIHTRFAGCTHGCPTPPLRFALRLRARIWLRYAPRLYIARWLVWFCAFTSASLRLRLVTLRSVTVTADCRLRLVTARCTRSALRGYAAPLLCSAHTYRVRTALLRTRFLGLHFVTFAMPHYIYYRYTRLRWLPQLDLRCGCSLPHYVHATLPDCTWILVLYIPL